MKSSENWRLLAHPFLQAELDRLSTIVKTLEAKDPQGYSSHPVVKTMASIRYCMTELVPRDPGSPAFRQGDTLGPAHRHWFRVKFHGRYRLFYRFSSELRIIIYVWVNNERSLRKAGSKTDPYALFRTMLDSGNPPSSFAELLRTTKQLQLE
jgi:toxin YhaV